MTLTTPLSQILVNLLRGSQILTFESPAGIKDNLIRTFTTVPVTRMCREPHERAWLPVVMVTRCIAGSDTHLWVRLRSESLSLSFSLCLCVCLSLSLFLSLSPSLPPSLSLSLFLSLHYYYYYYYYYYSLGISSVSLI